MKNFIDEDWTGLSHIQIRNAIRAELEEQQCAEDGHRFYPVFICRTCGESFELGGCKVNKKKKIRTTMNHVIKLLEEQEGRK